MSCGQAHSSARELVAQGKEVKLVAETLAISRSSLYYQRHPRGSRADRSQDQEIILACGEKPAYGYRRVVWWLGRHHGLVVNGKRALRVMRERGLLVRNTPEVMKGFSQKTGARWKRYIPITSGSRT